MTSNFKLNRTAALVAWCLTIISMPALAVINQTIEFPDAQSIQGATLSLAGSNETIPGEVREEDDRKIVVFILPDGYEGRSATANVTVDNVRGSYPIVIGMPAPVFRTGSSQSVATTASGGWYFGAGIGATSLSSDFATALALQSATDADDLLAGQGLTNIDSMFTADDSAFGWDGIIEVGYLFPDESRVSLDVRTGSFDDFGLTASASGDIPMSASVVTAQSVATAGLDIWSANMNYGRFFTPDSNWGFLISLGSQSIDRPTSFTSTISVDGVPIESMTGGEKLDENVILYGAALEWTQRQARNWIPTVGVRLTQSGDIKILDNEKTGLAQLYFTIKRRPGGRR